MPSMLWRARISIPLSTPRTCWIRGWGLGQFPPRNVQKRAGALLEKWGNIAQQDLANMVQSISRRCTAVLNAAGGHTRYWLLLLNLTPPFVQGHIVPFMLVTYLWNLSSLRLSSWILLCSYKYLHMSSLLKINTVDSERTFLFLLSLYYL